MFEFVLIALAIVAATAAFVWQVLSLRKIRLVVGAYNDRIDAVKEEVERVFSDDFREELRNRGRLYFEKIINENAMFLKQDLGLTASQLNEYMQASLKKVLEREFEQYKLSIGDAKEAALSAITKTQEAMESQRAAMAHELEQSLTAERERRIAKLDTELSRIANEYLLEVLAGEVDLGSQSDYIFSSLDAHKADIIKDLEDAV